MNEKKPGVGVAVMILNNDGHVLLGKRHDDPEKAGSELHGEGTWTLPGGKLEFGESLEDGAAREALEECGIKINNMNFVSLGNEIIPDAHFITVGFASTHHAGEPKVMEPDEITEWKWFALDSLPEPMFPPALKVITNYSNKTMKF